ncbi:hypothetical protein E2C01_061502 [Portunus trituberculatus]|uniref:Uncharacterized protein n=1 Tax=Portunus trituberculatus TaxID=210409 RepID=A0A5B7HEJ5_PORTR|nr:hypothetical protein [Portunus trituberculatus]
MMLQQLLHLIHVLQLPLWEKSYAHTVPSPYEESHAEVA